MTKLTWVLCEEKEGKYFFYKGPKGVPTLDHEEIKNYLIRK